MKLRLLYHGHCFDGVSSAALFTRFYHARGVAQEQIAYTGLIHRAGSLFDEEMFDGEENAIVDFKYSASERLTWWFDHHQSAFLSAEDERHFETDTTGRKFWDAARKSCTEFIADILRDKFDFHDERFAPLIAWAHTIDGAFYTSAAQAVELREPALQLMQVIESTPGDAFNEEIIRRLSTHTLDDVATSDDVQQAFRPIREEHERTVELIRTKAEYRPHVVSFDLADDGIEGFNKFIPYHLHPGATYSVAVTRGTRRSKISVGSNPWARVPRTHNIAEICERYGGGGHAVVGAVSFAPDELERTREAAAEIVRELSAVTL